jgi:ferritin
MNSSVSYLIEESVNLELNASELYLLFHGLFPDDREFWWGLALEEKAHAALFRSGIEVLDNLGAFPRRLLYQDLQDLKDTNNSLLALIDKFRKTPPSRREAFCAALDVENSTAELHFREYMDKPAESALGQLFRDLNKEDNEHATRIQSYMDSHGIVISKSSKPGDKTETDKRK